MGCGSGDGDQAETEETQTEEAAATIDAEEGAFDAGVVYDDVVSGVVSVTSVLGSGEPSLFGEQGQQQGQGTGFVVSSEGEIVTNAHVVATVGASGANVTPASAVYVEFADRNRLPAEIVGLDVEADVALLEIDPSELVDFEPQPLELGSSAAVEVGDQVAAIGNPFSQNQSLSTGVVSATDRSIESLTQFRIDGAIQTDASINPGNSGGPLLDPEGRVIGINQQIATTSGANEGVGFAVPGDLVEYSLEQLREDGSVEYAYLGVQTRPLWPQLARERGIGADTGALVVDVVGGSPADEAGIRGCDESIRFQGGEVPVGGDVIVAIGDRELADANALSELVSRNEPGSEIELTVVRDGERREIEVELASREQAMGLGQGAAPGCA